jgi:trans-2,3-dihydro-3-hydroxyanthranilate isomerase
MIAVSGSVSAVPSGTTIPDQPPTRIATGTFRYVICDVFTDVALAGNQLCVFTDARAIPEARLQALAREINFSETVFVYPALAGGHARIRIFTPANELPFAGHPVLGTAFVLAGPLQLLEIRLETGAGVVPVALEREHDRIVFGRMSQPMPSISPYPYEDALLAALRVDRSELPLERYDNGVAYVFVVLAGEEEVARLEPDVAVLVRLAKADTPIVGINCVAGADSRWKSRMFAPAVGVPEDPATGSAAGPLACHLARHGLIVFGQEIEISQGAEIGRPSTLYARADGSPEQLERVEVGGAAVVVARGEFRL